MSAENSTRGGPAGAGEFTAGPGSRLDQTLASLREAGRVGVMTHIVFGYPTTEASRKLVEVMVRAGVDLIEVQIPFSDPTADGPTITRACQKALDRGVRVADAITFLEEMASAHPVPFLFMSYYNVVFNYRSEPGAPRGVAAFARAAASAGAAGLIVPDAPPEEVQEGYPEACREHGLHPVYVISPNIDEGRLRAVERVGSGLVYCTSRTGTTGKDVEIEMERLGRFLGVVRDVVRLPVAVGFSISKRAQIEALRGVADVAVIGSHLIRVFDDLGVAGLKREVRALTGKKD